MVRRFFIVAIGFLLLAVADVHAVDRLELHATADVPALSKASVEHEKWLARVMVDAYDKVGNRDPKWDELARKTLELSVDMWGPPRSRGQGNVPQFETGRKAMDAGCDDPMVLYAYARTFVTFGHDEAKCLDLHRRAADGFSKSKYTAYYKALAQLRVAELLMEMGRNKMTQTKSAFDKEIWDEILRRTGTAMQLTRDMAKETDLLLWSWIDLGDGLQEVFGNEADILENAIGFYEEFAKNAPRAAALTVKGDLYTNYAWQARGRGFADTVTPEGWKLMRERLDVAQKSLEEGWKLDGTNSLAAARMISVELGQGQGRERMELWFKRAMEADPDDFHACNLKLYYLEPKWYGSVEAMVQFGRECLKTGRFRSNVPSILIEAHERASHYTHGGFSRESDISYYQTRSVWKDLRDVYEGYLRIEKTPQPIYQLNCYAQAGYRCQAWEETAKIFALIGEDFDSRVWTKKEFDEARAAAIQRAGK